MVRQPTSSHGPRARTIDPMKIALLNLLLAGLLLSAAGLSAQTETVINDRDAPGPPHDVGAGWSAGVNPETTLIAHFILDDPAPKPGSAVNYDLRITNMGEKAVVLPRALDWKVVEDGSADQQYVRASVTLELSTDKAITFITPTMNLYLVAGKPDTSLTLRPGDSVRLLGTATMPLTAFGPNLEGPAEFTGHLCVHQVSKSFTHSSSGHKFSSSRQQMLWCVNADEKYEVNYGSQQ